MPFRIKSTEQLLAERGLKQGGRAQKFVDSECLRYVDKYVPFRTGFLKNCAKLASVIGSGIIRYTAPYARSNYYSNRGFGNQGMARNGLRGRLWFERMKAAFRDIILAGAARITGATRRRR